VIVALSPIIVGLINLLGIYLAHRATNAHIVAVHAEVKQVAQQVAQVKGGTVNASS
jgi:hypothetical protein